MPTYRYEGLVAWQEAFRLSVDLGQLCKRFPSHERFDLVIQLRRAARTIPANIAEGANSQTISTNIRHLGIALGSVGEVDNHLKTAHAEGYLTSEACEHWRDRVWKVRGLVLGLQRSLYRARDRETKGSKDEKAAG